MIVFVYRISIKCIPNEMLFIITNNIIICFIYTQTNMSLRLYFQLNTINELGKLACLADLKINHNALGLEVSKVTNVTTATVEYTLWYMCLAKIGHLKSLNKTLVSDCIIPDVLRVCGSVCKRRFLCCLYRMFYFPWHSPWHSELSLWHY